MLFNQKYKDNFIAIILSLTCVVFFSSTAFAESSESKRSQTSEETFNFPSRDGTRLFGRFYKHPKPQGLVVVIQGMQNHTEWYRFGDRLAEAGFSTFLFDRRGSGRSDGKKGHLQSPGQLIEDLESAMQFAVSKSRDVPIHLLAHEMGFYSAFSYAKIKPKNIQSLLFLNPRVAVLPTADHMVSQKGRIYISPSYRYFSSPLKDTDFVSSGDGLEWIRNDTLGQREFTASFLRALNSLHEDSMSLRGVDIKIPMLFVLATKDRIIDNGRAKGKFFESYPGPKKIVEIDSEHFIGLTPESELLNQALLEWLKEGYRTIGVSNKKPLGLQK